MKDTFATVGRKESGMFGKHKMMGVLLAFCMSTSLSAVWAAQTPVLDLSNAEVIVTSSSNTSYVGMANTDAQGRFSLNGVPAGGINVVIRRNGAIIAQGAGVTAGGNLNEAQELNIMVAPLPNTLKSGPSK
jgi:hypothetical protein